MTFNDVSELIINIPYKEPSYYYCFEKRELPIKVGGMWVSPVEIENIMTSHEAVLECAVVGALDDDKLVKPKAFVVLKDGFMHSSGLVNELQQFVLERAAAYKHPRWVEFVEGLPRTATGKVQRFKLRG